MTDDEFDATMAADARQALGQAERDVKAALDADRCPFCGGSVTRVVDTHLPTRRRECQGCKRRYNTREVIDAA